MRLQKLLLLFVVNLLVINIFASKTYAAELSGRVLDSVDTPLSNSKLLVKNSSTQKTVTTFQTDPFGNYVLQVPEGTYDLIVIPTAGSGIPQLTKVHITINGNMQEDITMQATSKLPLNNQKAKSIGTVSYIIIGEIVAVVLVIICYFLWEKKIIRFSK